MNRIILISFLIFHQFSLVLGQNCRTQNSLQSAGLLSDDFLISSGEKYNKTNKQNQSRQQSRSVRLAEKQFYVESNFYIDALLFNGLVWTGDSVTSFVNAVADKLLESDPALRKKIRIYITRSPEANAFATDQGIICINIGLLARLNNEAELAYVLAHEIIHFLKRHSISGYVRNRLAEKGVGEFKNISENKIILSRHLYSKSLEVEADELGLKLLAKSKYDICSAAGLFSILEYAQYPYENKSINFSSIAAPYIELPGAFILDSVPSPVPDTSSSETHPSLRERNRLFAQWGPQYDNNQKQAFIVNTERGFIRIRNMARNELAQLYYSDERYEECIYTLQLLMGENNQDRRYDLLMAKALFGIAFRNSYKIKVGYSAGRDRGVIYQARRFFEMCSAEQKQVIAFAYFWELHKQSPEPAHKQYLMEILNELTLSERCRIGDVPQDSTGPDVTSDERILSWQSLRPIWTDAEFLMLYEKVLKSRQGPSTEVSGAKPSYKKSTSRASFNLLNSPVDTLIVFNPFFIKLDERKDGSIDWLGADESETQLLNSFYDCESALQMKLHMIDAKAMKKDNIDAYNDLCAINTWIGEMDFKNRNRTVIPSDLNAMRNICKKYNSKYLLWTGVVSEVRRKEWVGLYYLLCGYIPGIPVAIYKAVTPRHDFVMVNFLFDLESGKLIVEEEKMMRRQKATASAAGIQIYDFLRKIKYNL